jgi:hypothetical protein
MLSFVVLLAALAGDTARPAPGVAERVSRAVSGLEAGRTTFPLLLDDLRLLPAEETVDALIAMIGAETYADTAYYLLSGLPGAGYPRGLEALLAGLGSAEPSVRGSVSRGLMHAPDERRRAVQAALVAALIREASPAVRAEQLSTLGHIGQLASAEEAAPVVEILRSENATDNEHSNAAEALLFMIGWRRALEQFRSTPRAGRAGLLAILVSQPRLEPVDAERDVAYRGFALEQLESPIAQARLHALQLIPGFIQGLDGGTLQTRAANLELRAAFERRLERETDAVLRNGLQRYCELIDAEGNVRRLPLPTGSQPTPRPDP